jgi:hypothetical protein
MAHIKYRFREGYCEEREEWSDQCSDGRYAEFIDCPKLLIQKPYRVEREGKMMVAVPCGGCLHSCYKTVNGEKTVKKYEIETDEQGEILHFEMGRTELNPEDILFLEIDGAIVIGEEHPKIYEEGNAE